MTGVQTCALPISKYLITTYTIGVMIKYFVLIGIENRGKMFFSDCHSDCIGKTLSQRSGGSLHSRCIFVLRMARCFAAPLSEILQILQRKIIPGQMKDTIL